jgi:hypothetical protein
MNPLLVLAALTFSPPDDVVAEVGRQIAARYVLVDEAPHIAEQLLEKAGAGAYDGFRAPEELAETLTSDLRAISGDLHFAVEHHPELAARLLAAGAGTSPRLPELEHTAAELDGMRRSNYGFRRIELLAGNVALIELERFDELALASPTASAAMAFAAHADAVIVDVRRNAGGRGDTVGFLVSYFLAGDVEMMSTFDRETGETRVSRTLTTIPGMRMLDVPLFILIGPGTGSGAEAFAFALQRAGRATIVGQRSVGAAQGGGWVPVGDGFVVFIPTFRSFDPKTGRNWEGTGVQPDVVTDVDRALETAHWRAVAALDRQAERRELRWLLPLLECAASGPAEHDISGLAGRYEGIEITAVGGSLKFLGASGVLRNMIPLSDGTFLIEDSSVPGVHQARVRFIRDGNGAHSGLELLTADGDVIPRSRL